MRQPLCCFYEVEKIPKSQLSDFYLQKLQLIKRQVLDRDLDELLSLVIFLTK